MSSAEQDLEILHRDPLPCEDADGADMSLPNLSSFVVSDASVADMPIVYVNPAFEQLTGYLMSEVVGKNCRFLQGTDTNQPEVAELRTAMRAHRPCRVLLRNYRKDGSFFWNDFSITPIVNGYGELTHFVGVQNQIRQQDLLQTRVRISNSAENSSIDEESEIRRIGDILVEQGVISQATVFAAEQLRQTTGKRIGEILVEEFRVPVEALVKALSIQVENARAASAQTSAQTDVFKKTAFAVRLAQKTMELVPETALPIYSICQPLSDAGGDIFYRVLLPDETHLLVLADVAGHSVISSYAVAAFLGMLCALSRDFNGLRKLLSEVNTCLQTGPFCDVPISVLAAHWNIKTGRLHLINAAMPHAICLRAATGAAKPLELNGNPLGILEDPDLGERVVVLGQGDRVVFGSDGIFESASPKGRLFEEMAPAQWSAQAAKPLGEALLDFCESARNHVQGYLQDDLLLVAIEQPPVLLSDSEFRIEIGSNFEAVDTACEHLLAFVASLPALQKQSEDWSFALLLAAREALTNAVIHGNQHCPEKSTIFAVNCDLVAQRLWITVTDEGSGYEVGAPASEQDLQCSERGRGLSILREFAQSVQITANELRLEFSLERADDEQP